MPQAAGSQRTPAAWLAACVYWSCPAARSGVAAVLHSLLPACRIMCRSPRRAVPRMTQPSCCRGYLARHAATPSAQWPLLAAELCSTLSALACSALPEEISQLAGLTRLSLERNYVRELPASLARLQGLEELR